MSGRLTRLTLAVLLTSLSPWGCGGGVSMSGDLRTRLSSEESANARARAPDLIASVEAALDEADRAERAGDTDAASDHVTRARLLLDAASAEAARIDDEEARRAIEVRVAEAEGRARRDEQAREQLSEQLVRLAASRVAQEEAASALAAAETDEGRGARRGRVSLEEARDLRRGAAALRARAELLLAAAQTLGADEASRERATRALAASSAASDPLAALREADRAQHEALRALGAARAEHEAHRASVLAEAARAEGFEPASLPEGTAVEAAGLFASGSASLSAAGRARVQRLASLLLAHPEGPVQVQTQSSRAGRAGARLATQRAEALVRALVSAGVGADRLDPRGLSSALASDTPTDASRLVFVAYVP